jgi:hypothetical protein
VTRPLDFLVIGAQKSGTTSLHHYLSGHPELFLPMAKEVPFFTPKSSFEKGWEHHVARHFADAPAAKRWGKVTPHYMTDLDVPGRVAATMPKTRLVALLRHPIERALSHHRMTRRRGNDPRTAVVALTESLAQARKAAPALVGSTRDDEHRHYLGWSLYGRILAAWLAVFPPEQLLVCFLDEMERDPAAVLERVQTHLGVDPTWRPQNLGERFLDSSKPGWYRTVRLLRHLLPRRLHTALTYRLNAQAPAAADGEETEESLPPEVRRQLVDFLRPDVRQIEVLLQRSVPWPEFGGQPAAASGRGR